MNPESLRAEGSLERGRSPPTSPTRQTQIQYKHNSVIIYSCTMYEPLYLWGGGGDIIASEIKLSIWGRNTPLYSHMYTQHGERETNTISIPLHFTFRGVRYPRGRVRGRDGKGRALPWQETGSASRRDPEGLSSRANSSNKAVVCESEGGGIKPERTVSKEEAGWAAAEDQENDKRNMLITLHGQEGHA